MKIPRHSLIMLLILISLSLYAIEDLKYSKTDKQTPNDINDDHIVVRKIAQSEFGNLAVSGGNIYFEQDKFSINTTELIKVEEIAKALIKLSSKIDKILIEGFASKDGESIHNMNLGNQRAQAVKKSLVAFGVPESKMEIVNYGEGKEFQFSNVNKNRRVQLRMYIKQ